MKRLRILIFAAVALVLLRPTSKVQAGFIGCIASMTTVPITVPCDSCCINRSWGSTVVTYENDDPGFTAEFANDPGTCGGLPPGASQFCLDLNPSCGKGDPGFFTSVSNADVCCPAPGNACKGGQCCSPETCVNGVCKDCVPYFGEGCITDCGGQSKYACDGSCPDPYACTTSYDCGAVGGGICDNGCCTTDSGGGGGCDLNAGNPCPGSSCGVLECDGQACDTTGCNDGYPGGGSDPCNPSPCGNDGCMTVFEHGVYAAECYDLSLDPVVVSLDGSLFPMTNAAGGVRFDFFNSGKPVKVSWTAAGAKVGWLVMDRTGSGAITNGSQLFSNVMPQPAMPDKRLGFIALAQWDKPSMGGNGDGQITSKDWVFSRLRVWTDLNHNGISDPGELLTMQQAGIQAISAHYLPDNWTDSYGNRFQNRAQISWTSSRPGKGQGSGGGRDQWAYDVVLLSSK